MGIRHQPYRIINISDIHLGHKHTPSAHIYTAVNLWLTQHEKTIKESDLFVISGDIWDRLVSMLTDDVSYGIHMVSSIMKVCNKYKIPLRILEGTRSHDWGQSNIFNGLSDTYPDLDYRYIAHLSYEQHQGLGKTLLYVPDSLVDVRSKLEDKIRALLKQHRVDKVDITICHTQFPHQLPKDKGIDFSDPDFYLSVTREVVISGHIHQFSIYKDRLVVPGSFDVLEHGQSSRVGGVSITLKGHNKPVVKRLYNSMPALYKRIKIPTDEPEAFLEKQLTKLLKNKQPPFNIQLSGDDPVIVTNVLKFLKEKRPDVSFSKHQSKRNKNQEILSVKQSIKEVKRLQANVLPDLIKDHLYKDDTLTKSDIDDILSLLKDIHNEYEYNT